ncbi:terpene synthase 10-like isoform X1 [Cannabis sativa]|uniref:terpene synthase 10-like isoform X1 n=2 Tax=Cannabis sativa TaxID=3483 RepID=UPI0029C9ECC5|nr:terpene synthase 10-like isoform X1 [Cannabis sativa]
MAALVSIVSNIISFNNNNNTFIRSNHNTNIIYSNKTLLMSTNNSNIISRRSANYQPPLWHFDYVQSLSTPFKEGAYAKRVEKVKEEVRVMVKRAREEEKPLSQLELIDVLQRLGISYHFEDEINDILKYIYNNNNNVYNTNKNNVYANSLEFRLLRQHGYPVSQEIFSTCKDERGNFMVSSNDIKGMLSLYEASFYLVENENGILEETRQTTKKYLEEYIIMIMEKQQSLLDHNNNYDYDYDYDYDYELVSHALELPLHWRMLRLESRWFIDVYEKRLDMNPTLLMLAKLDFNIVQSTYQDDLKYVFRWWKNTGLGEKLKFARDRMMVNFLWTIGVSFEPHYKSLRRMATKVNALITIIDDIYDVYGTLDELELFTNVVERWDVSAMNGLPEYMKSCFLALHNFINDFAFDVLKGKSLHVKKYLQKTWADLCKSYLREARWYYDGYTPRFEEYIENAWISISGPVILSHLYFFVVNPNEEDALLSTCFDGYPTIIRHSSMILRLTNDLATSTDELKRGDVPKSIQCKMHEDGVSEEKARQHIKLLINETWKFLNKDCINLDDDYSPMFSKSNNNINKAFIEMCLNLGRMSHCIYQYGDGHGIQDRQTKDHVLSLLIHPILLTQ